MVNIVLLYLYFLAIDNGMCNERGGTWYALDMLGIERE